MGGGHGGMGGHGAPGGMGMMRTVADGGEAEQMALVATYFAPL
jgi:hypothetical protein